MRLAPLMSAAALLTVSSCTESSSSQTGPSEEATLAARQACQFKPGALASETIAGSWPKGDQIPIDHIVLVMQENRSFDHYYSKLSHGGVDVASPDATSPDADGQPVSRYHITDYCFEDTAHAWAKVHRQYNDGKLDGFVVTNDPDGRRAMGYLDESDLPFYYDLARAFAISDRHFCSVLGQTWPNRMFYFAGTSFGLAANELPPDDPDDHPYPNLFTRLNDAKVSWKVYAAGVATPIMFASTFAANAEKYVKQEDFFTDAAAGTLPAVSVVEAQFEGLGVGEDEHPPSDQQLGQELVSRIVKALMHSPHWPRSALFLTYDEHGGLYDHVPPPSACAPDDFPAHNGDGPVDGDFTRYGFRVPLLVVSPYAKRGHVSHHVTDHTSILRFVETRFNMPAITKRDANAEPPLDMFDFEHPDTSIPTLRDAVIDPTQLQKCKERFPAE